MRWADDAFGVNGQSHVNGCKAGSTVDVLEAFALMIGILDREVLLGLFADGRHGFNGFNRILTGCGFAGKHDAVGAIIDGICNVGNLSTGGARIADHGIKHLSCRDNRLVRRIALLDDGLLDVRNLSCRNLDAQITTGNHDAVGSGKNFIKVLDAKDGLNLGEDLNVWGTHLAADIADFAYGFAIANEGCGNGVNTKFAAKHDVSAVLLGNGGETNVNVRNVDALFLAKLAAVDDLAVHIGTFNMINLKTNKAVVNQDDGALLNFVRKVFVVKREALCGSDYIVVSGDDNLITGVKHDLLATLKNARANLGSLGVKHDGNRNSQFGRDITNTGDHVAVVVMAAM